jgi:hypothetical protein
MGVGSWLHGLMGSEDPRVRGGWGLVGRNGQWGFDLQIRCGCREADGEMGGAAGRMLCVSQAVFVARNRRTRCLQERGVALRAALTLKSWSGAAGLLVPAVLCMLGSSRRLPPLVVPTHGSHLSGTRAHSFHRLVSRAYL